MKFSINQSELERAFSVAQKGIAGNSTMPVLSGIYVSAKDDQITVQTTDLQMSVQLKVNALVEEPGAAVLPGKLITDIVKNLPDAAVTVSVNGTSILISCEASSFSIMGLDPRDFPGFPEVEPQQQVTVPFDVFSKMAKKVYRTTSRDESRPILTGVLVSAEDGVFRMVATDSYRLAISEALLENKEATFSAVIAGSFIADLTSLPRTGEDITLGVADNQIVATYGQTRFINRRIEGKYPNYKQLLSDAYTTRCVVNRQDLISAVKRASLLDHAGSQVKIGIDSVSQTLQISSTAQDIGSTQETISAGVEGEDMQIAFNSSYVLDGLNASDSETVALEVLSSTKPGVFKGEKEENYLYLVMPVWI